MRTRGLATAGDWERSASAEMLQVLGLRDGEQGMTTAWGHGAELCSVAKLGLRGAGLH